MCDRGGSHHLGGGEGLLKLREVELFVESGFNHGSCLQTKISTSLARISRF
jgi:hypothetical protein